MTTKSVRIRHVGHAPFAHRLIGSVGLLSDDLVCYSYRYDFSLIPLTGRLAGPPSLTGFQPLVAQTGVSALLLNFGRPKK
jgi:hypothetical protein